MAEGKLDKIVLAGKLIVISFWIFHVDSNWFEFAEIFGIDRNHFDSVSHNDPIRHNNKLNVEHLRAVEPESTDTDISLSFGHGCFGEVVGYQLSHHYFFVFFLAVALVTDNCKQSFELIWRYDRFDCETLLNGKVDY